MYAAHYSVIATEIKRHLKDGRKAHVKYSVDMTERGVFIQDGFIAVSDLRYSESFGQTNHHTLGDYPRHMNKRLVCCTPVVSLVKVLPWLENVPMLKESAQHLRMTWMEEKEDENTTIFDLTLRSWSKFHENTIPCRLLLVLRTLLPDHP